MTDNPAELVESVGPPRRSGRRWRRIAVVVAIMLLLFGLPWWTLVAGGTAWPSAVVAIGTLLFTAGVAAMPTLMMLGHGHRHLDWAAAVGTSLLGVAWVLFAWSVLGQLLGLVLLV